MNDTSHRTAFRELLKEAQITQTRAAELIAEQTMRPCSPRTVRSWVNDPDNPHSRPCPEWAVKALRRRLVVLKLISAKPKKV